jgi:hypothetical protein
MATLPGISNTLQDNFSAMRLSSEAYGDRVVIIARSGTGNDAYEDKQHIGEAKPYVSLRDVELVHGKDSELFEAFYHAQYAGCADIWLLPLEATAAEDRSSDLVDAYETLYTIRPTFIIPYGRGAKIEIDEDGAVVRSVPAFGATSVTFPDGAYANSSISYLEDLADACAELSSSERICRGVIGIEAISDITPSGLITAIGEEGSLGSTLTGLPDVEDFTTPENSKFVSVVLAEVETAGMAPWAFKRGKLNGTSFYRSNGAINYVGLVTRLTPPEAATNKIVGSLSDIAFRLSRKQTLAAISAHCVTFNVRNGIVRVDDARTYAQEGSDFQRMSTMSVMAICDDMIRRVGGKFLGKGMMLETRDSFETALSSGFNNLLAAGVILDADFSVHFDGPNYTAYVDTTVLPAWELRNINFTIQVSFEAAAPQSV